jgi:WD40 repeat protein
MIRIFDRSKLVHSFEAHEESVMSLCFTNNPYELFSCGQDGLVKLWDLRKYTEVCSFKVQFKRFRHIKRNTMRQPIASPSETAT